LKVLYLSASGVLGGAERSLLDLLESIRQARPGWELTLLTLEEGDLNRAASRLGFATHTQAIPRAAGRVGDAGAGGPAGHQVSKLQLAGEICWSAPQLGPYIWKLRRFIRAQAPDVIHSNGFKAHLLATWTAPSKTAVIWHVRDYVSCRPLMSHLMRVHARRCTVALANSESVARDFKDVCRHRLQVRTVYNALDLRHFNPEGQHARAIHFGSDSSPQMPGGKDTRSFFARSR
jgi:hypothetical protein